MYVRIFWLIVIFKEKRASYALQAILEALLFTSKYRLQNWRCALSICKPSQVLKSGLAYTPQISLLYVRIGEIRVSNILQARAAFSFLRFVCRHKLKRAWKAFSLRCSRELYLITVEVTNFDLLSGRRECHKGITRNPKAYNYADKTKRAE